ncbi:MAG: uroporphyrinogen decarboxylase family protein [bacterium]|nr:uroporphyrinogen decarboxylase family protein [bacterium]
MSELTSLTRVRAALEHREPDRIPFDLGGSVLTGINHHAYRRLRQYLGLPVPEAVIEDRAQQLAKVDEDVKERLKVDVDGINPVGRAERKEEEGEKGDYLYYIDEWGIEWHMPKEGGLYYDMRRHPLAGLSPEEAKKRFRYPNPKDMSRYVGMKEKTEEEFRRGRAYILGRNAPGIFEISLWCRGFEDFYADMLADRKFAEWLMDQVMQVKWTYWDIILEMVGENVLIISEADDLAGQNGPLVSPQLYRELIKPRHTKLFSMIKKKAKAKVYIFFHTCGAVRELIPDLIESGVDILNPVQVSAAGMDTKELKKDFGKDITFWGGGVDTQYVLPKGNKQEIIDEVRRRIDDLAPGGGFVFAAVHNIQRDVPPENIMTMWETLQEYGAY